MKVVNIYPNFDNIGGAQKVALSLYEHLDLGNENLLGGFTRWNNLNEVYNVNKKNYVNIIFNIKRLKYSLILSHSRLTTLYLKIVDKLLSLNLHIVHIAHNEFNTYRYFSVFPKNIIAVSKRVKKNHVNYFKLNSEDIQVIYNGIHDKNLSINSRNKTDNKIRILYPARINGIKQQLSIVNHLKSSSLDDSIFIDFAGHGIDFPALQDLCDKSSQFNALGFINIDKVIDNYDYIMLFTKNEGLPLSLIEACMYGKPILANNVGGNMEILEPGYNGFELTSFKNLPKELNKLLILNPEDYMTLTINSRKVYESKFTIEKMIANYAEYLHENF